jgi:hypothetical protein
MLRPVPVLLMILAVSVIGCDEQRARTLSDEEFEQIYGDILYLGELHRGDTLTMRRGIDSVLRAHDTDSSALLATARELCTRPEDLHAVYRNVLLRFDTSAGEGE